MILNSPDLLMPMAGNVISTVSVSGTFGVKFVGAPASAVWPAADRVLFFPFSTGRSVRIIGCWVLNGAAVAGDIDIGIYDHAGTLLDSVGATAQAGVNVIQTIGAVGGIDVVIGPGVFYLAMIANNAAATTYRLSVAMPVQAFGQAMQAAAWGPGLPANAVMAQNAAPYVPIFGALVWPRTVI